MVTKLPHNATCRIIRATTKPNQGDKVFLETTTSHGLNAPPFYHPLDVCRSKTLQEFSKHGRLQLLELAILIMLQLVLIECDKWRMNYFDLPIQPYLSERKRKRECLVEK